MGFYRSFQKKNERSKEIKPAWASLSFSGLRWWEEVTASGAAEAAEAPLCSSSLAALKAVDVVEYTRLTPLLLPHKRVEQQDKTTQPMSRPLFIYFFIFFVSGPNCRL